MWWFSGSSWRPHISRGLSFVTHGLVPEFHLNKAHYITACSCSPENIPTSPLECGDTRREAGTWLISSHTRRVTCHVSRVTQARRFTAQDPSQLHDIYSTLFIFMVTSEQTRSDSKNPDLQLILNTDTQKVSCMHEVLLQFVPLPPIPFKIMITMSPGW